MTRVVAGYAHTAEWLLHHTGVADSAMLPFLPFVVYPGKSFICKKFVVIEANFERILPKGYKRIAK